MPRSLRLIACLAVCATLGLAGAAIGVASEGPTEGATALGTASADLRPTLGRGVIDAYVPIVDWGVKSRAYMAPVGLDLEVRGLDRDSVAGVLRSSESARNHVDQVKAELRGIVRREVWTAVGWALGGGAVGGLLGGALLAASGRRRWLGIGSGVGLAASAAAAAASVLVLTGLGDDAFREPVFYANGGELPELLAFSEQIIENTDRYTDAYGQALAGLGR
jgi:hypothetical protein